MLKITLDTNCIINLFDFSSPTRTSVQELSEIIDYSSKGIVDIAITTRINFDLSKNKNKVRQVDLFKQIEKFPKIPSNSRFGITKYGDHEKFWSKEDVELEKKIMHIIFPSLAKNSKRNTNKIADIDHLIGHITNKRDIFVTDDTDFLKKAVILYQQFDINVNSPKQCLQKIKLNDK